MGVGVNVNMRFGMGNTAAALLLAAALSGCAATPEGNLNPVTGKVIYVSVPPATEQLYGRKAYDKMIAAYGVYDADPALSAYVDRIGQGLAQHAVRKEEKYTFTILDDDEINGFALPGGYICITRGALNFANNEAELAGILAHEIGHIDAFHFGRGGGQPDLMKAMLSVLLRHSSQNAADTAMAQKLADQSNEWAAYSQQQELEADALGVHYMTLAGYDPQGIVAAIRTEDAKAVLDASALKDNAVAHEILSLDQSHPATPEREAHALDAVKTELAKDASLPLAPGASTTAPAGASTTAPAGAGKTERDAYLAAIDGMTFGADPAEGVIDGRRLVDAAMGFSFEVPQDFNLWLNHGGAFGIGPKAIVVFEATKEYTGQDLVSYVQSSMLEKSTVEDVHPVQIDGWRGATGVINKDPFAIRLAAVHDGGDHLYRLLFISTRRAFSDLDGAFIDSLKSFHALSGAEAKPRPPLHIHVVTVAGGDTVQSLADRMALKDRKLEWFRVLNGLGVDDAVKPGEKVKLVE
jgi:predicted Zn-dependent protease